MQGLSYNRTYEREQIEIFILNTCLKWKKKYFQTDMKMILCMIEESITNIFNFFHKTKLHANCTKCKDSIKFLIINCWHCYTLNVKGYFRLVWFSLLITKHLRTILFCLTFTRYSCVSIQKQKQKKTSLDWNLPVDDGNERDKYSLIRYPM